MSELYHLGIPAARVPLAAVLVEHGLESDGVRALIGESTTVGVKREFRSVLGSFDGHPVLVVDVGVGAPSTIIALEELVHEGARRIVWVGRRRDPESSSPEVIVPVAAIRSDGTSLQYAPLAYPALPDFAMASSIRSRFDAAAGRLVETTDVPSALPAIEQDLCSAALFVVGAARRVAVATVLLHESAQQVDAPVAYAVLHAVTSHAGAA